MNKSHFNIYTTELFENLQSNSGDTFEAKISHLRQELKHSIRVRYGDSLGYDLEKYIENELEAILEYGDPRAFTQVQYSFEPTFTTDKFGKSKINSAVLERNSSIQEAEYHAGQNDERIAMALGGYRMKKRMQISNNISTDKDVHRKRRKFKQLNRILSAFDYAFPAVVKQIKSTDMEILYDLSENLYEVNVKKMIAVYIHKKSLEMGSYCQVQNVLDELSLSHKGIFRFYQLFNERKLFQNVKTRSQTTQAQIYAAMNHIWQISNEYHQSPDVTIDIDSVKGEIEKFAFNYPEILNCHQDADKVLAILAMKLIHPKIIESDLVTILEKEKDKLKELKMRLKLAITRSESYRSEIKFRIKQSRIQQSTDIKTNRATSPRYISATGTQIVPTLITFANKIQDADAPKVNDRLISNPTSISSSIVDSSQTLEWIGQIDLIKHVNRWYGSISSNQSQQEPISHTSNNQLIDESRKNTHIISHIEELVFSKRQDNASRNLSTKHAIEQFIHSNKLVESTIISSGDETPPPEFLIYIMKICKAKGQIPFIIRDINSFTKEYQQKLIDQGIPMRMIRWLHKSTKFSNQIQQSNNISVDPIEIRLLPQTYEELQILIKSDHQYLIWTRLPVSQFPNHCQHKSQILVINQAKNSSYHLTNITRYRKKVTTLSTSHTSDIPSDNQSLSDLSIWVQWTSSLHPTIINDDQAERILNYISTRSNKRQYNKTNRKKRFLQSPQQSNEKSSNPSIERLLQLLDSDPSIDIPLQISAIDQLNRNETRNCFAFIGLIGSMIRSLAIQVYALLEEHPQIQNVIWLAEQSFIKSYLNRLHSDPMGLSGTWKRLFERLDQSNNISVLLTDLLSRSITGINDQSIDTSISQESNTIYQSPNPIDLPTLQDIILQYTPKDTIIVLPYLNEILQTYLFVPSLTIQGLKIFRQQQKKEFRKKVTELKEFMKQNFHQFKLQKFNEQFNGSEEERERLINEYRQALLLEIKTDRKRLEIDMNNEYLRKLHQAEQLKNPSKNEVQSQILDQYTTLQVSSNSLEEFRQFIELSNKHITNQRSFFLLGLAISPFCQPKLNLQRKLRSMDGKKRSDNDTFPWKVHRSININKSVDDCIRKLISQYQKAHQTPHLTHSMNHSPLDRSISLAFTRKSNNNKMMMEEIDIRSKTMRTINLAEYW